MDTPVWTLLGSLLLLGAIYYVHRTTQIQFGPYASRLVAWLLALLVFLGLVNMPIPGISRLTNPIIAYVVTIAVFAIPLVYYVCRIYKTWPAEWDAIKRSAPSMVTAMFLSGLARFFLTR
jgi:hypothetical protein